MQRNKRGAMEMSIGTIVTVVLSMALLIGGIMLVTNITDSSNNIVGMTNKQVEDQVNQLFGDDSKVVVVPTTKSVEIKLGNDGGFAFGIKNLLTGTVGTNAKFGYEVVVSDSGNCGVDESEISSWIILGKSDDNIGISQGDSYSSKVVLNVPKGSPLCTFGLRLNVFYDDNKPYQTDNIVVRTIA